MPLTAEEKKQRLIQLGFDPEEYTYESDLESPVAQTPTKNVISTKPSLTESFVGSLARGAPSALAAGATAAGLGTVLSATGVGAPIGIPITLAGAGLAGYGTRKLQESIAPSLIPNYAEQQQAQISAHPYASLAGEITSNLAGGLGPSLRNIPRAGRTLLDLSRGITPESANIQNLANVGLGAIVPPAQQLAISAVTGEEFPSPSDLLIGAGTGALFNRPNIIGRRLFRWPSTDITPYRFSSEEAAAAQRTGVPMEQLPLEEVEPHIEGAKPTLFMDKLNEILSQTEESPEKLAAQEALQKTIDKTLAKSQSEAEKAGKAYKQEEAYNKKIDEAILGLKVQKAKEYGISIEDIPQYLKDNPDFMSEITPEVVKRAIGQPKLETPLVTEEDQTAKITLDNLLPEAGLPLEIGKKPYTIKPGEFPVGNASKILAQLNPREVQQKVLSANSLKIIKDSLERSMLEGQIPGHPSFEQPESLLREQLAKAKIPLIPTESWHETFNKLAVARGIKLEKDFTLTSLETGKPIAGRAFVRQGLEEALAKINPAKAGLDTWPHELFHVFYQDLLASPNKFDNRIAQQGQLKTAQSETYKKSGATSPHEFLTQNVGEGVVKHIFNTEGKSPLANWFSDFWSYIKARFAPERASDSDYQRLLTNKLLYDKARSVEAPKAEITSSLEREKELVKLGKQTTFQQEEKEDYSKNIPGINRLGSMEIGEAIFDFKPAYNLENYYNWLIHVKGLSHDEASKVIKNIQKQAGDIPAAIMEYKGSREQPESSLTPDEEAQIKKEAEIGTRVPKDIMEFSRAPSNLVAYYDWLQGVKGLTRIEALKRISEIERALGRTVSGNRPHEQYQDIINEEELNIGRREELERQFERDQERRSLEQPESKLTSTEESKYTKSSFFPVTTSRFNKIAEKFKTPLSQYVSDNLRKFQGESDYLQGQIGNKLISYIKDFSPESINKVYHYLHDIDDTGKSSYILSADEKTLANNITTSLRDLRKQQIAMGIQVEFAKGKYRVAGIKPEGYIFNILDPKVPYTWAESPNSKEALSYDKLYVDHQIKHGLTPEEAQKTLQEYKGALGNNVAREIEFGALRRAEGNGLPWELVDQNFASASERYGRRAAKDMAYFKWIQNDPKMRSALGLRDQFNVPPKEIDPIASSREAQDAMRSVFGIDIPRNPRIMSFARLAANIVMGPGTAARNIVNMGSFIAQYVQVPQIHLIGKAFTNLNESKVRAFQSNAVKTSFVDFDAAGFYEGNPNPAINLLNKFSYYLRKYQGRDLSDKFEGSYYYSLGEQLAVDNIARAKLGNKESLLWVKKFSDIIEGDPLKKQITQDDISRIAKRFVDSARGTYSAEGLPSWALEGELAPFSTLSRFSIEKSNTIWQDVVQPMRQGVYGPLIRYTLASFGVGGLISGLNELLTHKRGQEPTIKELQITDANKEDWIAKAISLLQLSSFAGSISDTAKLAMQVYKGKTLKYSNPLSFPLYTLATDAIGANVSDAIDAIHQGEDPFEVMGNLVVAMSSQSMQTMRYLDANFWHPEEAERKEQFRDYRTFQELTGRSTQQEPSEHVDILGNLERKKFKRTGDIQEAVQLLPDLMSKAFEKATKSGQLDIDVLASEWKKIKQNSYQTMPNFNVMPNTFRKYLEYLTQSQGPEAAQERFLNYVRQNLVNEVKSELVPTL